jgi:hypothetical protein
MRRNLAVLQVADVVLAGLGLVLGVERMIRLGFIQGPGDDFNFLSREMRESIIKSRR